MAFELKTMENGQVLNHMLIVQHLSSGDYDLSEHQTIDGAWDAEKYAQWVKDYPGGIEAAESEFRSSVEWYWPSDALKAAEEGYTWPVRLGFVIEIED